MSDRNEPGEPLDRDKLNAREIRGKMNAALLVVCGIVETASRRGYLVSYATAMVNGHQVVTDITIVKKL